MGEASLLCLQDPVSQQMSGTLAFTVFLLFCDFLDHCSRCASVLRNNVRIQRNGSVSEGDRGGAYLIGQ